MRRALLIAAILIALPMASLGLTGDCDDDGTVELPEVVRGVVIALATRPLAYCEAFDANGDGVVDVVELIEGVGLSMTSQPTATATPSETAIEGGTPTDTPTNGATPSATASASATATSTELSAETASPVASPTPTPTPDASASQTSTATETATSGPASPTSTASVTATRTSTITPQATPTASSTRTSTITPQATATASSTRTPSITPQATATATSTRTPSATATRTASPTNTPTRTPSATATRTASPTSTGTRTPSATRSATATPTSSTTPTPTATPTLPRLFAFDFGSAGTGGIPCITTTINFQLLAGFDNVHDLRFDFCLDPDRFDVQSITCQAQNAGATIDPVEHQLSCDLGSDDPHGQVRVSAHGVGVNALPSGEVLFQCSVPVLAATTTGVYNVDYAILGNTTGDQAFVDFGQSTISIFADDLSQGQCCGADSQCSSGFCRGGYVPDSDSACCESDCAGGVCNDPLALGTCLAQPGGEFRVSTVTYHSHFEPGAAVLDDGFVVAWHGYAVDVGNLTDVFVRRYDRFGAPIVEATANQSVVGAQRAASVASLGSGFVVVWSDAYGVHGRRFDSLGAALANDFQVNTSPGGSQYYNTAVGGAPDGGFVVAWDSYGLDGFGLGIFGRRYDSLGGSVGGEFQVNSYTEGSESDPAVAFAPDGGFVVAWGGQSRGIVGQRFDSLGGRIGGEFSAPDLFLAPNLFRAPGLAVDADGSFVVAATNLDGSYFGGVFARRFDSSGVAVGSSFQVNTYTYATQRNPGVAFGQDSSFVVVWEGSGQDGYNYGIFGQRFGSNGGRIGSEFQVTTYTESNEREPAIAAGGGTDGFVVVWQGKGGYSYQGILAQRLP